MAIFHEGGHYAETLRGPAGGTRQKGLQHGMPVLGAAALIYLFL
jgi:hypothetical protein